MPPRPAKRARVTSPAEERDAEEEASASHLVSFLTGYDDRPDLDDEDGDGEGEDEGDDAGSDDEAELDDPDEEEIQATPTKRAKQGLVGSRSGRSTPRSTPTKPRRTPNTTPRKIKVPQPNFDDSTGNGNGNGPGFIRPSKSDAYFLAHARSSKTSGTSYSALAKPLSQLDYDRYASGARSLGKSKAIVDELEEEQVKRFGQWELELEQGFNILCYGFGSKRKLLDRFVKERLSKTGHCVVINGHYPQLGIRDILSQIEDALSIPQDIPIPPSINTPLDRAAYRIYAHLLPDSAIPSSSKKIYSVAKAPLYLIMHNIDSPPLRTPRSLAILSLLASSPRIHLIASFDHIHTPLLFSSTMSNHPPHTYPNGNWNGTIPTPNSFNWIYHSTPTYNDYDLELTHQRLSARSQTIAGLSGTTINGVISEEATLQILKSVPPMALRLLKLLLTKQLSNLPSDTRHHVAYPANPISPIFAVDNDLLQTMAREKFIAREQERYDSLMGEFRDHGLVVEGVVDGEGRGGRWVWVPLGKAAVERVLEGMREVEV